MSLFCGCVGKSGNRSPSHTSHSRSMSKLKPPAAGSGGRRFGFGINPHQHSTPVSNTPATIEMNTVANKSAPSTNTSKETRLTGGLALDPSALLMGGRSDSLGGYVSRNSERLTKPRPVSSAANLGQRRSSPEQDSGFSSMDDSGMPPKPKSGLRSLFTRTFSKDKVTAKAPNGVVGSNSNMNNSKSDGSLSGLSRLSSRGSIGSTGSSGSNHSTDSRSMLGYKRDSPIPSRAMNSSPTPRHNHADSKGPKQTGQGLRPTHSKLATSSATSKVSAISKPANSGLSKYSAQSKSKSSTSRLSYPMTKQTASSIIEDESVSTDFSNIKHLHNNNVHGEQSKGVNIDSDSYNIANEVSAPVATADTDSETSFSVSENSPRSLAKTLISNRSPRSMSAAGKSPVFPFLFQRTFFMLLATSHT